jgi:hypothetical protein
VRVGPVTTDALISGTARNNKLVNELAVLVGQGLPVMSVTATWRGHAADRPGRYKRRASRVPIMSGI